jgi:hypothetical protein
MHTWAFCWGGVAAVGTRLAVTLPLVVVAVGEVNRKKERKKVDAHESRPCIGQC